MKAFIMAAGVGTRLEPLTLAVPKPMVPVCNIPVMQHNIELLKKHGINDIVANLHYFPEQIECYFRNGRAFGVNLEYSYEENLMGTAGGVKKMASSARLSDQYFVVLSSDVLMDIDLKALISFHKKKKALATIALTEVEDTSEFGVVILDKDWKITAFQEKPKKKDALSNLINTGVYIFNREILSMIPDKEVFDFGRQLFPRLVKNGFAFYGMKQNGYWKDIGSIENYKAGNFETLKKKGKGNNILIGKNCKIDPGVRLEGNVIIGDNCLVRQGTEIKSSIIWSETVIDSGVKIDSSIIGSWCYIERGAVIEKDCVVGNRCRIRADRTIKWRTSIKPDQVV